MALFAVSDFVRQHADQFAGGMFFDQGVEESDPGKLSNHSSGTAIDLNATKHPLGKAGTFPVEKIPMIQALTKKYGLNWGGNWTRQDAMHWEIAQDPIKTAKLIEKLGLNYAD